MTDFLLELRSEEIPARMQDGARAELTKLFGAELAKAGLNAARVVTFATPRRLVLIAHDLPLETQAVSEETKGPKVGAPPQALEGFLRKTGLTQDQLIERDGVYFAVINKPGRKTADVLAEAIPAIIRAFSWPKSMRWGAASVSTESLRWVRPLQGIVALLGDDVVPCTVDGITSGAATMGHRFHHSGMVTIGNASDYAGKLRACHVIVDQAERQAIIREGAAKAAADAGLTLVADEALVAENAGLTEWPVPLLGHFDESFLVVPPEVIRLTAKLNQKYFMCEQRSHAGGMASSGAMADGKLANAFVCTANISAHDGGAAIIAGNERVLAARLSDAKFFYEQDLKTPLAVYAEKLNNIVFHEKLGTVADKVARVAKLARWLVESGVVKPASEHFSAPGADPEPISSGQLGSASSAEHSTDVETLANLAEQAARLCKADLVTGMVGEFPELQGVMGGYYARAQELPSEVADAIRDHYKPVGQGDEVPTAPVTVAVSLADKLDTLVGFFAIDEKPTGSKDPFALRRAGLALLGLIMTNELRAAWFSVMSRFVGQFMFGKVAPDIVADGIASFLVERLKVQQRVFGVRHDLIEAVFNVLEIGSGENRRTGPGESDYVRLLARVRALQAFITTEDGANLLAGYKRAANILKAAEKDGHPELVSGSTAQPQQSSLTEAWLLKQVQHDDLVGAESALLQALNAAEPQVTTALADEGFTQAMSVLATLRAPIDQFFADVMVNDPDPAVRTRRLGLLARFRDAVHKVADFSRIEG